MEGKRKKKENPVEVNVYEEWARKTKSKTQKVTLASLLRDKGNMLCCYVLTISSSDLDQTVP